MLTKRTNILFDEESWNDLVQEARSQKTSVGALVRGAVRQVYGGGATARRASRAVDKIRTSRPEAVKTKTNYKELIEEGRDH